MRLIDRDKVLELKMRALEALWLKVKPDAKFDEFCADQGDDLTRFATFCTLAEEYKSGWHNWPESFRHPANAAVAQFAIDHKARIEFHKWLQYSIDQQLGSCAQHLDLMQDLPIGCDPDGADAWAWQDVLAKGVAVGAPPDEFNTQGQTGGCRRLHRISCAPRVMSRLFKLFAQVSGTVADCAWIM